MPSTLRDICFDCADQYRVGRFWRYRASELSDWLRLKSTGRIARVVSIKEKP